MNGFTFEKENPSSGDYRSFEFSSHSGKPFELTISGSTLATIELNNPDKKIFDSFVKEELPKYLFRISQTDPSRLGFNRYDLTTQDVYFSPNLDIFRKNLETAVVDTSITKVVGNLPEFQNFKDELERLTGNEKSKLLSKDDFVAFKDQLANLKYHSYPYYGFFLVLIGGLLEKLNIGSEKVNLLSDAKLYDLAGIVLEYLKKEYPNYQITTKDYHILERRDFIKIRKYFNSKKLQNEDETIASVMVIRHKYAHGNNRKYEKSCRFLGIKYLNPAIETEFEANIRCICEKLTSVLLKLESVN